MRYYDSDACAHSSLEELIAPFIRGDGNGDGRIDLGDAIAILNILLAGAPPPEPQEALDANADGARDIGDPIYLLNYLFASGSAPPPPSARDEELVRIVVIYDNYASDPRLEPDWGFSCLVDAGGERILVDTGNQGARFLRHMELLAIDAQSPDVLVLSREHADHVAGLPLFLGRRADLPVYIPASFPSSIREGLASMGARPIDVAGPVAIGDGIFSTGELAGSPPEQEVIVETGGGLVLVVPCAHPGIVEAVEAAKAQRARELFRQAYGADFLPIGVGSRVALPR